MQSLISSFGRLLNDYKHLQLGPWRDIVATVGIE